MNYKSLVLLILCLILVGFVSAEVNLRALNIDLNDPIVVLGEAVDINVTFDNNGDENATAVYNVLFYINDELLDDDANQEFDENLNAGDSNTASYVFTSTDDYLEEDVNVYVCIDYNGAEDDNAPADDCNETTLHVYSVDLAQVDIDVDDASVDYGDEIEITFDYENIGDANANDYNVVFYANGDVIHTESLDGLDASDTDSEVYIWETDIGGEDINIMVCLESDEDVNSTNNCAEIEVDVDHVDLHITELELNDATVTEGASVEATVSYENTGTLDATSNYTIKFYRDDTLLTGTGCNTIVSTDLEVDDDATKICTFTAPSVSSTTDYDIEVVINYVGDSDDSDDSETVELRVSNSSSNSSGSGSTSTKKVDFKAMSLTAPTKLKIGETTTLKFVVKNAGTLESDDDYTVKMTSTLGKTVKTICSNEDDVEIDNGDSETFECDWKPTDLGKYTITATITYDGTETSRSNNSTTKIVEVYDPDAVVDENTPDANKPEVLPKVEDYNIEFDTNTEADENVELVFKDKSGKAIANQTVTVIYPDDTNQTFTTDANGEIDEQFTMPGTYYVLGKLPNGADLNKSFVVLPASNTTATNGGYWTVDLTILWYVLGFIALALVLALVGIYAYRTATFGAKGSFSYRNPMMPTPKQNLVPEPKVTRKFSYSDGNEPKPMEQQSLFFKKKRGLEKIK